jgi:genome maintenance exonuclease 1
VAEIINKFTYQRISRSSSEETGRTYVTEEGQKLPSVTTILSKTKPANEKAKLDDWKKRVGEEEANRVRDEANSLGTKFHTCLEKNLKGEGHKDLTDQGQLAEKMSSLVITNAFPYLKEIWGSEVFVHYPNLYAGQTDLIGIYKNRECIMDFKTTNKPKREDWIKDYFLQLGAYAMAHNHVYGTEIKTGVIFMVSRDLQYQCFAIEGERFAHVQHEWLKRVDQFYAQQNIQLTANNVLPQSHKPI